MNKTPYPYQDFLRVQEAVFQALMDPAETYILLTGETGTGKTALLRQLKARIDRTRVICYFSAAKKLGAAGLVKVLGETLHIHKSVYHVVSFDRLLRTLHDESQHVLLWFDEAHDLPNDTLGEARALVESDLDGGEPRIQVLLAGLPRLRQALQMQPHLWRRILVREELDGLHRDEMRGFVEHHFGAESARRLCDRGIEATFEHGKGSPGLLLPILKQVFRVAPGKSDIAPDQIDETLSRYDLA